MATILTQGNLLKVTESNGEDDQSATEQILSQQLSHLEKSMKGLQTVLATQLSEVPDYLEAAQIPLFEGSEVDSDVEFVSLGVGQLQIDRVRA